MPLNFPSSPSVNDTYSVGARTWKYNGYAWELQGQFVGYTGSQGVIGFTGSQGIQGATGFTGSLGGSRVTTISDGTSITVNANTTDLAVQNNTQSAGTLTINAPTGSPVDGQRLMIRITSSNPQTLTFNAIFSGSNDISLPTSTTGSGKEDYLGFMYDAATPKWHLVAKSFGY